MKNRRISLIGAAALTAALSTSASAQLTWDPTISGGTSPGGDGTWDTTTGNWWDGAINTTWDNTGATTATFSTASATEVVSIGSGLIVGDLTKTTGFGLQFDGSGGNQVMTIKSGGASWDTGAAGAIEFTSSAGLSITSGDTLAVGGTGDFDAGQTPGTTWTATGATLSYTGASRVIGNKNTIGQFGTVQLAVGMTRFIHEGANNDAYANNWELTGTGEIAFDGPSQNYTLAGDISGSATMRTEFIGSRTITLNGDNSAWTGGLKIGNAAKVAVNNAVELGSGDLTLAGTNNSFGVLLLAGVDLGSRDLILGSTRGGAIVNQGVNSHSGKITGSTDLQIGHANHDSNTNKFIVSGTNSDHTGTTRIWRGTLELGADDALSHATVMSIGGEGTAVFQMNGYDAEIAGLALSGGGTRQVYNSHATEVSTLTFNVADTEDYAFNGGFAASGPGINVVKNGLGTQQITNSGADINDLTVNGGSFVWGGNDTTGTVTVSVGTLQVGNGGTSGAVGTGGAGNLGDGNITNNGLVIISRSDDTSYTGVISGTGLLQVRGGGNLTLDTAQTHTGETRVVTGTLTQGLANAVSSAAVLTMGGASNSYFQMNGFDAEIAGLRVNGGSTRQVKNDGAGVATLTINVADGETYTYPSQFAGATAIDIVKTGLGTQELTTGAYVTDPNSITVNAGELQIGGTGGVAQVVGAVTVTAGNLAVTGRGLEATSFTVDTLATASMDFRVTDWAGAPQVGYTQISTSGNFTVSSGVDSFTIVIDDANLPGFVDSSRSFAIASAGTLTAASTDFKVDASGFSVGTGTWSVAVAGNDVNLIYTTTADPYAAWAASQSLTPPDAGETDDKENDGIDNILEWVLGGDPLVSDPGILPASTKSGTDLIYSFNRADSTIGTVVLTVQYGSDLLGWTDVVVPTSTSGIFTITDNVGTDFVVATIPVGAATEQFVRLKAE